MGPWASSATGQGWLKPSCKSGMAQDVLFSTVRVNAGTWEMQSPSSGQPRCTFALRLLWDTARDEGGWGSCRSLPAPGGHAQPRQEQAVDTPTAPSAHLRAGALRSHRPSPPVLPPAGERSHSLRAMLSSPKKQKVFSVSCAAALSKAVPIPRSPMRGTGQVLPAFSTPFSRAQPGTSQGGPPAGQDPPSPAQTLQRQPWEIMAQMDG